MAYLDSYFNDYYDEICIHEEADALRSKRDSLKEDIQQFKMIMRQLTWITQ